MVPVDWVALEKDRPGNSPPQTEGRSGDVLNLGRLIPPCWAWQQRPLYYPT